MQTHWALTSGFTPNVLKSIRENYEQLGDDTYQATFTVWTFVPPINFINYKKVLLRERKRHTARRVVSTPSVVLPGYPDLAGGGYPTRVPPRPGSPPGGYLVRYPPGGRYLVRYPPWGVPSQVPPGGYPVRYPPGGGTRSGTPPGGVPGQVPPQGGTRSGTPPVDRQTPVKTVPSRRTTYAGGKNRNLP